MNIYLDILGSWCFRHIYLTFLMVPFLKLKDHKRSEGVFSFPREKMLCIGVLNQETPNLNTIILSQPS